VSVSEPGSRFLHPVLAVLAVGMAAGILHRVIAVPLLGLAGAAVGLGLAPGYALAGWLAPGEREWVRVCRGLFLSPLVTGAAGVGFLAAGLTPGTAAVLVAGVSLAAAILVALRAPRVRPPRWERRLLVWLLVLAALVLVPHALREWVRYRSDAWFHTAVAYEIMARGIPPDDPYFAGIPLNYPWFFHVIVVLWTSLAGARPWNGST